MTVASHGQVPSWPRAPNAHASSCPGPPSVPPVTLMRVYESARRPSPGRSGGLPPARPASAGACPPPGRAGSRNLSLRVPEKPRSGLRKDIQTAVASNSALRSRRPSHSTPLLSAAGTETMWERRGGRRRTEAAAGQPPGHAPKALCVPFPRLRLCARRSHSSQGPCPHTSPRRLANH